MIVQRCQNLIDSLIPDLLKASCGGIRRAAPWLLVEFNMGGGCGGVGRAYEKPTYTNT